MSMPFEPGGIADKLGNRYEELWCIKQLLRLLDENYVSVQIEPLGENEDGVDLIIKENNRCLFQQCKANNGSSDKWTIYDLKSKKLFDKLKKHVDSGENIYYEFITGTPSVVFKSICYSASKLSDGSSEHFYEYQIKTSQEKLGVFKDVCNALGLDANNQNDRLSAFYYLKKCIFTLYPFDDSSKEDVLFRIKNMITGDSEKNYGLLLNFIYENYRLGIYADNIWNYLSSKGAYKKHVIDSPSLSHTISELNAQFENSISPLLIGNKIISRQEIKHFKDAIKNNKNIIIHGCAGSGKSSFLLEIIEYLKKESKPYVSIRLDRKTPSGSASIWGKSIGLPDSPDICLSQFAGERECFLILDQLDALRWGVIHSHDALDICKSILRSIALLKEDNKKIYLILTCRSFDLENDVEIKNWLGKESYNAQNDDKICFEEIKLGHFSDDVLRQYTGKEYNTFTQKQKTLLTRPICLKLWLSLYNENRMIDVHSFAGLLREYINLLVNKIYEELKMSSIDDIYNVLDIIINFLYKNNKVFVPNRVLSRVPTNLKEALATHNLIKITESNVGFCHQSFSDYLIAEKIADDVNNETSIANWLGDKAHQTLAKREQIRLAFDLLFEEEPNKVYSVIKSILNSDIRFHLIIFCLEVTGTFDDVNDDLFQYMFGLYETKEYSEHILYSVFNRNESWFTHLMKNNIIRTWLTSGKNKDFNSAVYLLSMTSDIDGKNSKIKLLLSLYEDFSTEQKQSLLRSITHSPGRENETDLEFSFRLKLASEGILVDYIEWKCLAKNYPERSIQLLCTELNHLPNQNYKWDLKSRYDHFDKKDADELRKAAKNNASFTWDNILPYFKQIDDEWLDNWLLRYTHYFDEDKYSFPNIIIIMFEEAGKNLAQNNPQKIINDIKNIPQENKILKQIICEAYSFLPATFSEIAINWLIEEKINFESGTGINESKWCSAARLIKAHSPYISDTLWEKLELMLYSYTPNDWRKWFPKLLEHNKNNGYLYDDWGECQYFILPALPETRISHKTLDLMNMLNRKFSKYPTERFLSRGSHTGGAVVSPITKHMNKLSNKSWLEIIQNRKIPKERSGASWKQLEKGLVASSSVNNFANSFGDAIRLEPKRFTKLVMELPDNIHDDYIYHIYNALGIDKPDSNWSEDVKSRWKPASFASVSAVVDKFINISIQRRSSQYLCWLIKKRSEEQWKDNHLMKLCQLAVDHNDPNPEELNVIVNGQDKQSINSLWNNTLNCTRGVAAIAIGSILWHHKDKLPFFKTTIEKIITDPSPVVRMAALKICLPVWNINRKLSFEWYSKLCTSDKRITACHDSVQMLNVCMQEFPEKTSEIINDMCLSTRKDVLEQAAKTVTAYWLFYDNFENQVIHFLNGDSTQRKGIADITAGNFWDIKYHDKCKRILIMLINDDDKEVRSTVNHLFWDYNSSEVNHTFDFIQQYLKSMAFKDSSERFFSFLTKVKNENLLYFKEIIFESAESLIKAIDTDRKKANPEYRHYRSSEKCASLIIKLYEQALDRNVEIVNKCLDIFDKFYYYRAMGFHELIDKM